MEVHETACETVRLAYYKSLCQLAEHFGFETETIGVDIDRKAYQFPEMVKRGEIPLLIQVPEDLASVLL